MIDWKSKLTSRKFWMAIVGFVTGILIAFKVDAKTVDTVSGVIMAGASVIAYIIGEGLIDAAGATPEPVYHTAGDLYIDGERIIVDQPPDSQKTD